MNSDGALGLGRLLPFGEAVGVRLEPDGVPLAVHVEEPHEREPHASQKSAATASQQRVVVVLPAPPSREVARWARRASSRERTTRSASFHAVRRIGTLSCSFLPLDMATAAAPEASTEAAPRVVAIIFLCR